MRKLAALLAFVAAALTASTAFAQQQSGISIYTKNLKPTIEDGLYLINLKCHPAQLPEQKVSLFEKLYRQIAFTITLSSQPLGANQQPPSGSTLNVIPVTAATISTTSPVKFDNANCSQSFLMTGRVPVYLTAVWADQQSHTPSQLVQFVENLAGMAAPLASFFNPAVAAILKADTGATTAMSASYSQLVGQIDWSIGQTKSTKPLETGYYLLKTPAGSVDISVEKIPSIQSTFAKHPLIKNAFDASLQPLGVQVASNPNGCIGIGRAYELYQNLSHSDAVYALSRIVVASALPSDKAATCLGAAYGPDVAQDPYWKQFSGIVFPPGGWQPQNVLAYSQLRFDELTGALTDYASGTGPKIALDEFFSSVLNVTDLSHIFGNSQNATADQIADKLKGKKYLYYGCPEADTAKDDNGNAAVGNFLAVDQSLGVDKLLLIRAWWALDRTGNSRPRINELFISTDGNVIAASLKDNNNTCANQAIKVAPAHQ